MLNNTKFAPMYRSTKKFETHRRATPQSIFQFVTLRSVTNRKKDEAHCCWIFGDTLFLV